MPADININGVKVELHPTLFMYCREYNRCALNEEKYIRVYTGKSACGREVKAFCPLHEHLGPNVAAELSSCIVFGRYRVQISVQRPATLRVSVIFLSVEANEPSSAVIKNGGVLPLLPRVSCGA
jgi:hypothetical protein